MSAQLESPGFIDSQVEPTFDGYVHKLRLHAGDGGHLIELIEQRLAERKAEARTRLTLALIAVATLLALLTFDILK